jgi:hypothetical protein
LLLENLRILSIQDWQTTALIGTILPRYGISSHVIISLGIRSTAIWIVTWLQSSWWSVLFEIESTWWHSRWFSICALCTTISAIAMKCALDFRFETVALRWTYLVALLEFSWIEPAECA